MRVLSRRLSLANGIGDLLKVAAFIIDVVLSIVRSNPQPLPQFCSSS